MSLTGLPGLISIHQHHSREELTVTTPSTTETIPLPTDELR